MLSYDCSRPKCEHVPKVDIFYYDLTSDVIGDQQFNKIRFHSTKLSGLSHAGCIFKISPVVLKIGGGPAMDSDPPVGRVIDIPQCGVG